MSVYIKGMDMPKCCAECVALHDDGNSLTCLITHEPRGYMFPDTEERMSNCPLIPVPPHGRLIDADAIKYTYTTVYGSDDGHNRLDYVVGIDEIDEMPAIIPASEE